MAASSGNITFVYLSYAPRLFTHALPSGWWGILGAMFGRRQREDDARQLPSAWPRLQQGFEREIFKIFLHPLQSLINVGDDQPECLSEIDPDGAADSKVRPTEVKDRGNDTPALALQKQIAIGAIYELPAALHDLVGGGVARFSPRQVLAEQGKASCDPDRVSFPHGVASAV